jgi:hypothetical protein
MKFGIRLASRRFVVVPTGIEPVTFRVSGGLATDKILFLLVRGLQTGRIGPLRAPGLKVSPYFGPYRTAHQLPGSDDTKRLQVELSVHVSYHSPGERRWV